MRVVLSANLIWARNRDLKLELAAIVPCGLSSLAIPQIHLIRARNMSVKLGFGLLVLAAMTPLGLAHI